MGHGFDDQGGQFGPTGKFENWWTDAAKKAIKDRTEVLSAQYDAYEPVPGTTSACTSGDVSGDASAAELAPVDDLKYVGVHECRNDEPLLSNAQHLCTECD